MKFGKHLSIGDYTQDNWMLMLRILAGRVKGWLITRSIKAKLAYSGLLPMALERRPEV